MEDNENNNSELGSKAKETAKKTTKKIAKKTTKLIMSVVKNFVLILLKYALIPLLIVTIVVACIWLIAKTNIHSKIEYITSDTISHTISQATQGTNPDGSSKTVDFSPVAKIEGNDQNGYYIKVDGNIVENIKNSLQEEGIEPKDLGLQSFDCFRTFIETEIMTQFPNVGNGRPENVSNDIITNGCINIQRAQVQEDGTSKNITLKYTALDNFNSYCENNDSKALDYFTINESGEMLVASYSKTQTGVTTQGDTSFVEVPEGQNTYNISTRNINYKNAVNKYTMPFMFLIGILESSNSEEIALELAELAKNTQITITIEDNIQTTDITEKTNYVQKYEGTKQFKYTITKIEQYVSNISRSTLVNNELATVQASPEAKECTITIQTHTETNTPNIEITYVDSWIAKVEREYTSSLETTNSSSGPTTSENSIAANINNFNINTDPDVAEFMNSKIRAYTQQMEQTPIPNDPNFVSRRIEGSKRDLSVADLKQVLTITNEMNSTTVSKKYTSTNKEVISNEEKVFEIFDKYKKDFETLDNAQELLYKLLEDNSSTCNFSDTMKYLINKYKDPNYAGELNLSFFDLNGFTTVGDYMYGNTIEEKVWFALRDAGYSEESVAGVLGNIYAESAFNPTIIEEGSGIGFGLCQWSEGRRTQLEAYIADKGVELGDIKTQIEFLLTEITPGGVGPAQGYATYQLLSYNGYNGEMWENATTPEDAATAFCWSFERPGEPRINERTQKAREYYEQFKGRTKPSGGIILQIADEIHKYMENEEYSYCVYGSNGSEECSSSDRHGLNITFEASKTGYHHSCCATYVSWVLQETGYIADSEHTDSATALMNLLMNKGWSKISSISELEPGDVLYYSGHIEIYAGDGKVYNAGSGNAIRNSSPANKNINSMIFGLRAPN